MRRRTHRRSTTKDVLVESAATEEEVTMTTARPRSDIPHSHGPGSKATASPLEWLGIELKDW